MRHGFMNGCSEIKERDAASVQCENVARWIRNGVEEKMADKYKLWLQIEKITDFVGVNEDYDRVSPVPEYDISFDTLAAA